ncbi:MAG: hypothetical protein K8R88_10150 [Armatimonadetes bacterium]|nr:hypothetical protein [Armatimonadota bacterium]
MTDPTNFSRRKFLAVTASSSALLAVPSLGQSVLGIKPMEPIISPKLVTVPQAIPDKVYGSEKVGISRKTHDEHLKLWQGYANKTN